MTFAQLSEFNAALEAPDVARQRSVVKDFQEARLQASLQDILARLTGQNNRLLSFEEVTSRLHLAGRMESGLQEIPLAAIIGSVGRYTDFTRSFLPRRDSDLARWANVRAAYASGDPVQLPPIEVYQVGEVYFILDGNHRVSVARRQGLTHIEAHIIRVPTTVPLTPELRPDDLILKAEYADFLAATGLSALAAPCDLSLTVPGGYQRLRDEINVFGARPGEAGATGATTAEAAQAWYASAYLPLVQAIRERGLLHWFPGRTETDLYLWISEHHQVLQKELDWAVSPEAALTDLAVRKSAQARSQVGQIGSWRKTRLADRYADHLFFDILVPVPDAVSGGPALEQALVIAKREGARLHGLHVTPANAPRANEAAKALRAHFHERCAAEGVTGSLVIEAGAVAKKICERAVLADLVVLSAAHPPATGLAGLGSGLRTIVWDCPRPVLAVGRSVSRFAKALLLYDGSPKAREALFVAAYLAEQWQTAVQVLALLDGPKVTATVLDYPRAYLDCHEIKAEYVVASGNADVFRAQIAAHQTDLVLLGGYSVPAVSELLGGSIVNGLLREAPCPLMLCR